MKSKEGKESFLMQKLRKQSKLFNRKQRKLFDAKA